MRKFILICSLMMVAGVSAYSQGYKYIGDPVKYKNALKVNPVAYLGSSDMISYEFMFTRKTSLQLGVGFHMFKIDDIEYAGVGAGLQYRVYFSKLLHNWYLGLSADYNMGESQYKETPVDLKFDYTALGGGLRFGKVLSLGDQFYLDVNAGVNYTMVSHEFKSSRDEDLLVRLLETVEDSAILPVGSFALGFRF